MANTGPLSTDEMLALMFRERDLEQILRNNESSYLNLSFADYISSWCRNNSVVPEHVINRANLDRSYGHQLFNGKRTPSRDTVIKLAFGMEADVAQAQRMLRIAGKSTLYPRVKRDTVIIYCLHNGISLIDTEIILADMGLPVLGGGKEK